MWKVRLGGCLLLSVVGLSLPLAQEPHHPQDAEKLGTVHFETSCSVAAQPQFDRAMALLHSFEFGAAIDSFAATLKSDPQCAMAYWGTAVSVWGNPFAAGVRPAAQLERGLEAIEKAKQAGPRTEREHAYIAAASTLYVDFEKTGQRARTVAYGEAMAALAASYPEDREASIFYALSLAASALPTDKTYANQLKAGAILEKLFPEQPDHPGIAHYIIHSYDVPPLAGRALDAARRYGTIAPAAPHALHMPSHTFTRVGLWQESIDANIASAATARQNHATAEELHAMDYQTYAYLQTAQDEAARRLVAALTEVAGRFDSQAIGSAAPSSAGFFALAAIPARYALERRAWTEAAKLEPRPSPVPYTEAVTHFARALGAARTKDEATARISIDALQQIHETLVRANEVYWAEQVDIQRRGAAAWLALAEGRAREALALMRDAADREDRTDKNAVTPGPIAPARELLAEMLLETKETAQALTEFEATLEKEPNRFRAVYGAARAAAQSGNRLLARSYYDRLLKLSERADEPGRTELAEARTFDVRARAQP